MYNNSHLSRNVRKRVFGHVRPAKIQISLRICAVWSEVSLGTLSIAKDSKFIMRTTKTLIRPRGCTGWFESSLVAYVRRYVVWRCCSFYCARVELFWHIFPTGNKISVVLNWCDQGYGCNKRCYVLTDKPCVISRWHNYVSDGLGHRNLFCNKTKLNYLLAIRHFIDAIVICTKPWHNKVA